MLREYQEEINRLKKMLENPALMKQMMDSNNSAAASPTKTSHKKNSAEYNSNSGSGTGTGAQKTFDSGEKRI